MYKIAVFAVILAVAEASTNVQRCRNNPGLLPTSTTVEGCTNPPCLLPQLQHAAIHITFRAPYRLDGLRTLATAFLSLGPITIPVPYDLGEAADTCSFLTNTRCPISEGTVVNYTLRLFIEPFFPVGTVATIELRIVDSGPLFCVSVPIRVVEPRALASDTLGEDIANELDQLPVN